MPVLYLYASPLLPHSLYRYLLHDTLHYTLKMCSFRIQNYLTSWIRIRIYFRSTTLTVMPVQAVLYIFALLKIPVRDEAPKQMKPRWAGLPFYTFSRIKTTT